LGFVDPLDEGRSTYSVSLVQRFGNGEHCKCIWHKWEINIKMGLQEVGWRGMNWIDLAHDRDRWWALVNAVTKLWVAYNMGNFLTGCRHVSFSGRKLLHRVC
jgi:hypothetical protein